MKVYFILILIGLTQCSLFDNSDSIDYGVCDKELFDKATGSSVLSVIGTYDFEFVSETMLSEQEITEQRNEISNLHQTLIDDVAKSGIDTTRISEIKNYPYFYMFVDTESLEFIFKKLATLQ